MCRVLLAVSLFALVTLVGCDRNSPPAPPTAGGGSSPATVEIRAITPLLPRLQTHLAIDSRGNLYWTQESDPPIPGGDLVFVMGPGGVPQAVAPLNVDQVLATLGMVGGRGAVRALAIGPGDELYALFTGSRGAAAICAVLDYSPVSHRLTVAADTAHITDASGMGPSIALARGSLLGSRDALWLWLRHSDGAALLKLTPQPDGSLGIQPITLRSDVLKLRGEGDDLSVTRDGTLYYVDRTRAALWQIGPNGQASELISLVGLSEALPPPAGIDGHLLFLAGGGPKFAREALSAAAPMNPLIRPNLNDPVLFDYALADKQVSVLDRTRMDAPINLPLQGLQPRQLRWDPATGTLVTFDAASGEILRLTLPRR